MVADPSEIADTLAELIASFGMSQVAAAATAAGLLKNDLVSDAQLQSLRRYTLLIIQAKHPRAVAQIVGRLCYLDTACGHDLRQEDIAREIGVSKQAVCNMEADIAAELNLPRRSSPKARQAHALMNRRNYSHAQPSAAPAARIHAAG